MDTGQQRESSSHLWVLEDLVLAVVLAKDQAALTIRTAGRLELYHALVVLQSSL